ncbi:hypothetical protein Fleli_1345 [Bernardetia litoralis DSM 6794]|uniref:Tetratricopeptide repeat protein n=1 Tax=Bernardetia litoralis (strain ATCC 23117 / DSM 6794 / NBRC 15988 / NCIMB 1366 / Fx l1 / Sio-4) TaxID=880071 RepID=I4AIJ2_BERLS|nr:hypothetical protein [Bernardetia litoralis]AFM03777.1 hypothetical protein Fleli_1345 [Bernardetia litoralis DSM 6794]
MCINRIINKFVFVFCITSFFVYPFLASASLWDNETSKLNTVPYQTVMQVLVGNHLKHSQNYHFWRISMYEEAWNKNPDSLILYDAMAVSYHLTGRTDDAIRLMIAKERKKAGEYSTYANLVTFYIADRELYKARFYAQKLLKKFSPLALRDKYQVYWIDYLIECAAKKGATKKLRRKITLPVQGDFTAQDLTKSLEIHKIHNFYTFLAKKFQSKKNKNPNLTEKQLDEAIFAMLQLLRFSHSENILVIEAIGDLFLGKTVLPILEEGKVTYTKEQLENQKGAAQEAAFAYLRAAQIISKYSPKAEKSYTFLANSVLLNHQNYLKKENRYTTEDILIFLAQKIQETESYLNPIFEQEKKWIEEGAKLDEEFALNYLPDLENYSDSTFFIKTDTTASQFIYIINNKIPDYLVVDSLQKSIYLAAFLAEEEARKNNENIIIVSRIDTKTSIIVGITALISLSLAIVLFVRFRKK